MFLSLIYNDGVLKRKRVKTMSRVYNFSAGPSMLPQWVLETAAKQMVEYENSGQSVMEMSHRSSEFQQIIENCEQRLRRVMNIPDNYKVLFCQGGASLQFTMIPLNLLRNGHADVIHTGQWSKKAIKELNKIGRADVLASSEDKTFSYIPELCDLDYHEDADYIYICENNTIYGTKFKQLPPSNGVPLVSDMSSCILSEPVDVSKYGLIFAGAQKNMGPAGLTVVIIRDDLIAPAKSDMPSMLSYQTLADNDSMFNTPPTYAIYICGLVLQWIEEEIGGLEAMKQRNLAKASVLYDYLDTSKMFHNPVNPEDRSLMNVTFVTGNEALDAEFIKQAKAAGFINVKGHRSVGGMRASIYNAMPIEGVEKLVAFMKNFEKEHQ